MSIDTIQQDTALAHGDIVAISDDAARYPGRFATVIGTVHPDGNAAVALEVIGSKDGLPDDYLVVPSLLTKLTQYHQSLTDHLPERGDRVVMIEDEDRSNSAFTGKVVTIGNVTGFPRYYADGHIKEERESELGTAIFRWAEFPKVRPSEEVGIITDLQESVARLTNERDNLAHALLRSQERFNQRDGEFERSIETIGERLLKERSDRGWCSEFNDIVNEVNDLLPVYKLPVQKQKFTTYVDVEGSMVVSIPIEVEAESQEDAYEEVKYWSTDSIDEYLSERGQESIDSQLTTRASRRSFDSLTVIG